MKKPMFFLAAAFTASWLVNTILYLRTKNELSLSLSITFGTFAYHFIMRLIVGYVIHFIYHNQMNYKRKWFQPKRWEAKLYKKLKVKSWKDKMPTYDVDSFSFELHSMEEIVMAMCQSEVVHEVIAIFSFVPVLFTIWFDSFGVFLITSILAAGFDMMFVIMQRYNRPRLVKILDRTLHSRRTDQKTGEEWR